MQIIVKLLMLILSGAVVCGCVTAKAFQHEKLSNPLMEPRNQFARQQLDEKFSPTRKGNMCGDVGIGGSCMGG